MELLEQGRTLNRHGADENWLSSRAQRGICFSLTLEADPVLFGIARAVRALPLLSPQKQDYSLTLEADPVLFGVARAMRALPLLSPQKQHCSLAKRDSR